MSARRFTPTLTVTLAATLALAVGLTGCSTSTTSSVSVPADSTGTADSSPSGASATSTPGAASSSSPSTSSPSTSSPSSPSRSSTASSSGSPSGTRSAGITSTSITGVSLVLEATGLAVQTGSNPATHYVFGSSATAVTSVVSSLLGGPLTSTPSPECGQGARTSAGRNRFTLLLDGSRFVGWTDGGATGRHLRTATGLGIGSTLAQVRAVLPGASVATNTLGPEFFDPSGFGGILDGTTPAGKVTLVYSGETCFFR